MTRDQSEIHTPTGTATARSWNRVAAVGARAGLEFHEVGRASEHDREPRQGDDPFRRNGNARGVAEIDVRDEQRERRAPGVDCPPDPHADQAADLGIECTDLVACKAQGLVRILVREMGLAIDTTHMCSQGRGHVCRWSLWKSMAMTLLCLRPFIGTSTP